MHSNTSTAAALQRTWLVTGASSGIGRAIALALAEAGHQVIAWGRDAGRLAALQASHPGILAVGIQDLADLPGLARAAGDCVARWPGLNGLVHCAGIQNDLLLSDAGYGHQDIEQELRVNLAAPVELTRALLPHLLAGPGATVVLVSSVLAQAPKQRAAVYSASKAGLQAFAQSLRAQTRRSGLQVMELVPPLVDTPMTEGRGRRKLAPSTVADALLQQLRRARLPEQCWVGPARWLPWLLRLAPRTTRRAFLR